METSNMERFKKFISIILNTKSIGILSTIYGLLSFVRDEFLPLDMAEKLRLGGIFRMIDWYWWVIFGVIVWAISVAWESTKHSNTQKLQTPEMKKVDRSKNVIGSQRAEQIINYFGNEQKREEAEIQDSKITNQNQDKLNLFVEQGGHITQSNEQGDIILCLAIDVVNLEKRKIIELEAHLSTIYQWSEALPDNRSVCIDHSKTRPLAWTDEIYKIDLPPGFPETKLKIALLNCMTKSFAFMHPDKMNSLELDSIYYFRLQFRGKLEGNEPDYKYFDFETEFVCSPQNCILDYLPEAAAFPNFPKGLKGKLGDNKKQNLRIKTNINWDDVKVELWEKRLSENEVRGGIIIKNEKGENIEKCYVEINEIYDEDGLGLYYARQAELPRTAGWEIDGKIFYGETEITIGKRKYLALAYESWIISGSSYFFIGGNNNFQHHISTNETYFVQLEISGAVKGIQLKPITKFITIHFDGKILSIKNVSNELPKK